jgi:hypothetical protein
MIVPYDCPHCKEKIQGELTRKVKEATCAKCGKTSTIPYDWVKPGVILGNGYRVVKKLDEDSQAKLFLAHQEAMDREVAMKPLNAFNVKSKLPLQSTIPAFFRPTAQETTMGCIS